MKGKRGLQLTFGFDGSDESSGANSSAEEAAQLKVIQQVSANQGIQLQSKSPNNNQLPEERKSSPSQGNQENQQYSFGEGPEPSQDFSYKWVMKFENVQEVERSVPTSEFRETMKARELDAEFRLLRKLTETKEHL